MLLAISKISCNKNQMGFTKFFPIKLIMQYMHTINFSCSFTVKEKYNVVE